MAVSGAARWRPRYDTMARKAIGRYSFFSLLIVQVVVAYSIIPSTARSTMADTHGITPPPGVGPEPVLGSPGKTVGGIVCAPGVRQVPWSHYSPFCVPAWHGNNGGVTADGVSSTTITVSYRLLSSAEEAAFFSIIPESVIGTEDLAQQAFQAYIDLFNKNFELYGRKVVFKPFQAQSDFVSEYLGSGQVSAQADAQTARSENAFADLTIIDATPTFDRALADQKIITISPYTAPTSYFQSLAPYGYSSVPTCDKEARAMAQLVERSLSKTRTSFAGDPSLNGKPRVFGIVESSEPHVHQCDEILKDLLSRADIPVARTVEFTPDPATLLTQLDNMISQLKSAGVTTVLGSILDFFSPILISQTASSQGYFPEWTSKVFLDGFARGSAADEWRNAIALGFASPPKQETEAYKAFFMEDPRGTLVPSFPFVYLTVLLLFDALQQAGPYLTPHTFENGFQSIPPSIPGGMYGQWAPRADSFDPFATFGITKWSGTTASGLDGRPGAWLPCNGGAQYAYQGEPKVPVEVPLQCAG